MKGVVLISGSGSNLQSLIDNAEKIDLDIQAVISNKEDAYGLKRAQNANITTHVINHKAFSNREKFDKNLSRKLTYQFKNAFPKSIQSIPVSYGQADLLKVTVTFAYDRYILIR